MNRRYQAVPLRVEHSHGGLPMAPVHMAFLVSCTLMLTVLLGSLSRADVWVTVNPGGSVTRTEVVTSTNATTTPNPLTSNGRAQVAVSGSTTTAGGPRDFIPRTGYGIALDKQTWGIALDKQRYGIALEPQTNTINVGSVNGLYGSGQTYSGQTYSGLYPPVVTTTPAPVGYPYNSQPYSQPYCPQGYYPQPYYSQGSCPPAYYPQGYYPAYPQGYCPPAYYPPAYYPPAYYPPVGYYGYPAGPYTIPVGNPNRPSGWITHIGSSVSFPPAQPVCPPVAYPCPGGYNGVYRSTTVVSPSAGVTYGNRGAQIYINTGRSTTSTTVITTTPTSR